MGILFLYVLAKQVAIAMRVIYSKYTGKVIPIRAVIHGNAIE
jgi:hypothetical protein